MNTAGIVFLSLSILCLVIPGIISIIKHDIAYMFISIASIVCFAFFLISNYPYPTVSDLKDGKAIYIEEVTVGLNANGDTLYNYSTYSLEWLPEWEYGRKHN